MSEKNKKQEPTLSGLIRSIFGDKNVEKASDFAKDTLSEADKLIGKGGAFLGKKVKEAKGKADDYFRAETKKLRKKTKDAIVQGAKTTARARVDKFKQEVRDFFADTYVKEEAGRLDKTTSTAKKVGKQIKEKMKSAQDAAVGTIQGALDHLRDVFGDDEEDIREEGKKELEEFTDEIGKEFDAAAQDAKNSFKAIFGNGDNEEEAEEKEEADEEEKPADEPKKTVGPAKRKPEPRKVHMRSPKVKKTIGPAAQKKKTEKPVFFTETGTRYHCKKTCPTLNNVSQDKIRTYKRAASAKARGLTPCGVCHK